MSLNKAIESDWEHRKPYRGAKRIDPYCRNHGRCSYCRGNRLYSSKKALEAAKEKMKDENHAGSSV